MKRKPRGCPPLRGSSALGLSALFREQFRAINDARVGEHLLSSSVVPAKAGIQNGFDGLS
jgi:hypothetical protein